MWNPFSSVRRWIGNCLYFSKATLCIRGLVFSHSFVNNVVISVLITYLTIGIWKPSSDNFQKAAVAINMLDGVSSIMVCLLAYISNTISPFKVIVYTNAAYILGLVLLWVSVKFMNIGADAAAIIFYGAGLLLALGEAGRPAALAKFLDDQYSSEGKTLPERQNTEEGNHISTNKEEYDKQKRVETRQNGLWSHPWFLGAAAALTVVKKSWQTQLLLSMIAMGVSYLFFWYGVFSYSRNNSLVALETPKDEGLCQAIKRLSVPKEEEGRWKFWLKPNSRKRYYKEMLVMCLAFIVFSLVEATGSTFFFNQMSLLDDDIGNFEIPIIYFTILQSLSSFVISFLWRLVVPNQSKRATLVRICCGLICSVLCMVAAWRVEIVRKNKIIKEYKDGTEQISMSILWLIPQFSLLGFMRGLAADGLIEFFADRVDGNGKRKARYYASYASELVLGIGTLLTAVSILGFRHTWLVNDIYKSRLDKYYRGLVFISIANLCYYFCVAVYFYTKEDNSQVSSAQEENEQSEIPDKDKNHYLHDVSSDGAVFPDLEDIKSKFDCCSQFF